MIDYKPNLFRGYTIVSFSSGWGWRIARVVRPDGTLVDPLAWGFKNMGITSLQGCTDFVKDHIIEEMQGAPAVKEVVEVEEVSELVEVVQPMIDLFAQGE